jgi:hypothetical protein
MEKETCLICSQDYLVKNTKDHQCPEIGCMDCEFITDDPKEFEAHYCPKYISKEQLAKVISILDEQKKKENK